MTKKNSLRSAMTFLVVDDDNESRRTLCDYLKLFGYTEIYEAKDGAEALKIFSEQKIDFVISDWEMPGVSGLDLLKTLKDDERLRHVPFIMVTSPISKEKEKIERAAESHVDSYIIKPFRSKVLKDKIDQILLQKNLEKKGVLVVDDDNEVRKTVVDYLKDMGYGPIFEAGDGEEGYKVLHEKGDEIAFVISDWEMPKLAGIEFLRRIRTDDDFSYMPFIMITSQTSIERMKLKKALEADVDNYLLKPFRADDLKDRVNFALSKAKIRVEVEKELERAKALAIESKFVEAEKAYQKIFVMDPDNVRACLGLAAVQVHLQPDKGHEKAMIYIRRAITLDPYFADAHIALAMTYENAMSLEKAIACLKDATLKCDNSDNIHFHLGRLLLRRGRKQEAIDELNRALELNPSHQGAKELLGGTSGESG